MPAVSYPKVTPLHAAHRALKARMVPFGGWDMPVQYSGIIDEHQAVRGAAGRPLRHVAWGDEGDFRSPTVEEPAGRAAAGH